jgi:hypothetical protein
VPCQGSAGGPARSLFFEAAGGALGLDPGRQPQVVSLLQKKSCSVSTAPPPSDAIEAAALAAALAENALEFERKERTVGSFEHTPQHLYDVDDRCFLALLSQAGPALVAATGATATTTAAGRQLLAVLPSAVSGSTSRVFFVESACAAQQECLLLVIGLCFLFESQVHLLGPSFSFCGPCR